jgi:membrane-associated phospholipid phosphatase
MDLDPSARGARAATPRSRISPISASAGVLTLGLLTIWLASSIATKFSLTSLPNNILLIMGVVVVDALSRLAPRTRIVDAIQTALYGYLYLTITITCGVLAAYSMQRFAFPLQDQVLANVDRALGLKWSDFAHWVDGHVAVQTVFHWAYDTISGQILLPLLVFTVFNRPSELRAYLLGFAIAFTFTIVISALVPAAGPIAFVDRATFGVLQFTGATPLDHLMRLREAGPLIMDDFPGGIATFPSFHATIATLTPLTLRGHPRIFVALLILDAAMLGGTVTEGAHYFSDVLAGICMAFFAHAMAKRIIRVEDRSFHRRRSYSISPASAVNEA